MNDECPYCKNVMQKGVIHSDRYALKWIPKEKDKGDFLYPFVKGIKLTDLEQGYIEVFYCGACKKMIFEANNINES